MTLSLVFAAVAGVVHVAFFALESFLFTKPPGRKIFGTTEAEAETMKFLAFNQGFYNLFLAIGDFVGIALSASGRPEGKALVLFTCASMIGASLVLGTGGKKFVRGVVMQGAPPLLAVATAFI